jgi:hypothetical protein
MSVEDEDISLLNSDEINDLLGFDIDNINMDMDMDIKWVEENEKIDSLYKDFYKEDVSFINIHYIYINLSNEIERMNEDKYLLSTKNIVTKDEVLSIIHTNSKNQGKKYSILSILKYNMCLEPEQIPLFLKKQDKQVSFLHSLKNIGDIQFEKTIHMFHDLNDLYFLFYECPDKNSNIHKLKKTMKNRTRK